MNFNKQFVYVKKRVGFCIYIYTFQYINTLYIFEFYILDSYVLINIYKYTYTEIHTCVNLNLYT